MVNLMRELSQYYTEESVGAQLVQYIAKGFRPKSCIELSAGRGALLEPAIKTWPCLEVVTCEIDPENNLYLQNRFPEGTNLLSDVMSLNFETTVVERFQKKFDLAICNPPFGWASPDAYALALLKNYAEGLFSQHKRVRQEVLFFLQNVRLIKEQGLIAIIFPDLIIRSKLFQKFRLFLAKNYHIKAVIDVPERGFKGTEARTSVVIIQNTFLDNHATFSFIKDNKEQFLTKSAFVAGIGIRQRNTTDYIASNITVMRGSWTGKECRRSDFPAFHTTDIKGCRDGVLRIDKKFTVSIHPSFRNSIRKPIFAQAGDILVARIGNRIVGKSVYLASGSCIVSDCIFIVRFSSKALARSFHQKNKRLVETCTIASARGTCAKYIVKSDLKEIIEEISGEEDLRLSNQY